jgi:DUF1365 family protein
MHPEPALYSGILRHRRFRPKEHHFTFSLFMAFLDIDRIPELMGISPFLSHNRWNWASFDDRDHCGDPDLPLRNRIMADAESQGIFLSEGPIFLLTHLRYLGYCFNPVSFFYCYDRQGDIQAVLAEVNNTFGEHHNYWLWKGNRREPGQPLRYHCPKVFHVSPFMKLELDYGFVLTPPGSELTVHMNTIEDGRVFFDATMKLEQRPWSGSILHRALLRHPGMTAQVMVSIHWQALKLYLKKVPFYSNPGRLRSFEAALEEGSEKK